MTMISAHTHFFHFVGDPAAKIEATALLTQRAAISGLYSPPSRAVAKRPNPALPRADARLSTVRRGHLELHFLFHANLPDVFALVLLYCVTCIGVVALEDVLLKAGCSGWNR